MKIEGAIQKLKLKKCDWKATQIWYYYPQNHIRSKKKMPLKLGDSHIMPKPFLLMENTFHGTEAEF